MSGYSSFSIIVFPRSLKDSIIHKYIVEKEEQGITLIMEDRAYERLKVMTAEEYSPFLIGALGEFYAAKGFDFIKTPRMLKIVDAWIKSKDFAMTFDFVPNKDEPDGGMVVLKRVS